jgi:hypothetical protein
VKKSCAPSAIAITLGNTLILASYQGSNHEGEIGWKETLPGIYAALSLVGADEGNERFEFPAELKQDVLSTALANMSVGFHPSLDIATCASTLRRKMTECSGDFKEYSAIFASKHGIAYGGSGCPVDMNEPDKIWGLLPSSSRLAEDCLEGAIAQLNFYNGMMGERLTAENLVALAAYAVEGAPLSGYRRYAPDEAWEPDNTTEVTVVRYGSAGQSKTEYRGAGLRKIVNENLPDFSAVPTAKSRAEARMLNGAPTAKP